MPADASASEAAGGRGDSWRRVVLAALFALTFLLGCFPMADFDVWWHLRTGQLILERGAIPHFDIYTYTNAGRPWIDIYWLFQIVIALLYRLGGVSALVLLKASAGVAIVALALAARRPGAAAGPAVLAWLPALVALSGRLCERPELFSLLFLAGFLAVLGRASERPGGCGCCRCCSFLWVNSHGFFLLGPLTIVAYAVELLYQRVRYRTAGPPHLARRFALAGGAAIVACLINPYGLGVVRLPIEQFHKLGDHGVYRANIGELRSIGDFIALSGVRSPYLAGVSLHARARLCQFCLATFAGPFQPVPRPALRGRGLPRVAGDPQQRLVRAGRRRRDRGKPRRDDRAGQTRGPAARRGRRVPRPRARRRREPVFLAAIALAGLAVGSGRLYAWAGEGRRVGFGERPQWYAHESCAFLAHPGMPERIVAFNLGQAGVCICHLGEQHKLFMDPRLEVNSAETFDRYLAGLRGLWRGAGWEAPLAIDSRVPTRSPRCWSNAESCRA